MMKCPGSLDSSKCWGRFKFREHGCGKEHNRWLHQSQHLGTDTSRESAGSANHVESQQPNQSDEGAAMLPLQLL